MTWRPLFSPRPIEIGTAFEIEQIQTSPCIAAGPLLEAATETLISLPDCVIVTGTDITPSVFLVAPMALSMPARSLPITCADR